MAKSFAVHLRPGRAAAVVGTLILVGALTGCSNDAAPAHRSQSASTRSGPTPPPASSTPTSSAPTHSKAPAVSVGRTVERLVAREPAHAVSVAAVNMGNGAHYSFGSGSGQWTASVYKLLVLEVLLHQRGGPLTGGEDDTAQLMIEHSDNVAGYAAFLAAGGRPGLVAGARALGLKHTVPGWSDPTFTTTGAPDLLILLRNLVAGGPLSKSARAYALDLMRNVERDQRWGVGVIADRGDDFAIKNGWLSIGPGNAPGQNDGGRWAVNSVGIVTVDRHQVLVAVMTEHQPDFGSGKHLVEELTRAVRPAIAS